MLSECDQVSNCIYLNLVLELVVVLISGIFAPLLATDVLYRLEK